MESLFSLFVICTTVLIFLGTYKASIQKRLCFNIVGNLPQILSNNFIISPNLKIAITGSNLQYSEYFYITETIIEKSSKSDLSFYSVFNTIIKKLKKEHTMNKKN